MNIFNFGHRVGLCFGGSGWGRGGGRLGGGGGGGWGGGEAEDGKWLGGASSTNDFIAPGYRAFLFPFVNSILQIHCQI